MKRSDNDGGDEAFNLDRFIIAQEGVYATALAELKSGEKKTHWMWFIFPQIDGLGQSATSMHYSIKSSAEARGYLSHPVLGKRLLECANALLAVEGRSISEIFGYPDDQKLKSSMTLFETVAGPGSVFARVLDRYFDRQRDGTTLQLLVQLGCRNV